MDLQMWGLFDTRLIHVWGLWPLRHSVSNLQNSTLLMPMHFEQILSGKSLALLAWTVMQEK